MKAHDITQFQRTDNFDGNLGHEFPEFVAGGITERNMSDNAVPEEGVVQGPFGTVKILVGQNNIARADAFTQTADSADRHDEIHAKFFKAPDVGLVIYFSRKDPVSPGVAGQEIDVEAAQGAMDVGIGGLTEWGGQGDFVNILEPFELI
jgi:hypothetical protein